MCPCPTTSSSSVPRRHHPRRSWPRRAASSTSTRPRPPNPEPRAMATKVHMEALSPTMEEGRLVKWSKHEGDPVKSGDTLAEVETDKAVMELVARADGQLLKVMVPEGTTVPVGNVVAWIGKPGEKVDGTGSQESGAGAPKPAPNPAAAAPRPAATAPAAPVAVPADATRVKASPLARRIAKEAGVDLKLVQGGGPRAGAAPRLQRLVPGGSHPVLERGAHRHGCRDRGRAHHARDPQRRHEEPAGNRRGVARARGASPQPPPEARGIHGRHVQRFEPRHVRHRSVHRGDQPA